MEDLSKSTAKFNIDAKHGEILVEIMNKISVGELTSEIDSISDRLLASPLSAKDLSNLRKRIDTLNATAQRWHHFLTKAHLQ